MRQTPVYQEPQLPPWIQQNTVPQGEISLEEYQAQVADTARGFVKSEIMAYQQKVAKYESFKDDLNKVESKYPILNENSEQYDKEKAARVAQLYEKAAAGDPNLRLTDFVDSIMSFHEAGSESGRSEVKASVVLKDAEAAVTPNPETGEQDSRSTDWESMTLSEKEAWMKANGIWE